MFEQEFGSTEPQTEDQLRAELDGLEAERVDVVEARIDYWRWGIYRFFPLLNQIGKGRFAWASVLVIVAEVLVVAVFRSVPAVLGCLAVLVVLERYQYTHFVGWIEEHNARVDARIADALERSRIDSR